MGTDIMKCFPLALPPRPGQEKALDFIERMVIDGVEDIIIEAPTGAGKSAIGAACCNWAANWGPQMAGDMVAKPGGYYLVTQIGLQKQIIADVLKQHRIRDFACLWSSSKYPCDGGKPSAKAQAALGFDVYTPNDDTRPAISCQMGLKNKKPCCHGRLEKCCPYMTARAAFDRAIFSLTNYPWFLTERMFVGQLQPRHIMVLDECHTLEKQLLKFGEVALTDVMLREWNIRGLQVPEIESKLDFVKWLEGRYLPKIHDHLGTCLEMAKTSDMDEVSGDLAKRITSLENQVQKVVACIDGVRKEPANWVYWYDQTERDGNAAYCKPLDAAPYMDVIRAGACVRVYMSAFPGEKHIFCKSLGLDPDAVAWIRLKSEFAPENRPVIMGVVGSMSRRNQDTTMPAMLRVMDKIMAQHATEKGVIHCHSYELGDRIYNHFQGTAHGNRILFPKKADQRDELYKRHQVDKNPTIMLSPSMTEGYDFKFDEARWQIIAKVPYPYLGDKQVAAKKDKSQEWYDLQTVMSLVQASGRVCRDATDYGVTYVLDSDFKQLYEKRQNMFPVWLREAIVWT